MPRAVLYPLYSLLNANHHRCFTPKTFEVIIGTFFRQKSMNNDIAIIDKHPPVVRNSFRSPGADAVHSFGFVTNMFGDCLQLSC